MTHGELLDLLRERVAARLKTDPSRLDLYAPLDEMGLDSLAIVNFSGEIEKEFNLRLEPTVLWDHRTIWTFSAYLADLLNIPIVLPESEGEIDRLLAQLGDASE